MAGYNGLVSGNQAVEGQWAQELQERVSAAGRSDPNLVKTVEGAANFEKSTLTEITEARASVGKVQVNNAPSDPAQFEAFEKAQGALGGALSRLLVVAERYPDLKANAGFLALQSQLEGTENRIAVERGRFNEVVQSYNTKIKSIPAVFYAAALGFKKEQPVRRNRVLRSRPKWILISVAALPQTAVNRLASSWLGTLRLASTMLVLAVTAVVAAEQLPEKPARFFNDSTGAVERGVADQLNERLAQYERESSNQLLVAVLPACSPFEPGGLLHTCF